MKLTAKFIVCLLLLSCILLPSLAGCGFFSTVTPEDPTNQQPNTPGGSTNPGGNTEDLREADVVINEICADNKGSYVLGTDTPDWIELYNKSDKPLDLAGWKLADNATAENAYTFPAGTTLAGHSYTSVCAVGADKLLTWNHKKPAASFKLSENGETLYLFDPTGAIREEIDYPAIHIKDIEITYARINDGSGEWGEADPTPEISNNGSTRVLSSSIIQFSHESGFYDDPFLLNMTVPDGYTLYYSTDCTDPREDPWASEYTGTRSIRVYDRSAEDDVFSKIIVTGTGNYQFFPSDPVDKCFVVRAYVMDEEMRSSRTITKTYFVGYGAKDGYTDIPIITLTSDPYDLYDETNGLFIADKWSSSVNREEIVADMTYMNEQGEYVFSQKVGIRIRGTSTRGAHQKNLNIFARSRYDGNSSFVDPLFDDVTETKSLVLRHDSMASRSIGQGWLQELVKHREISTQDYYPAVLFLDGEYYGIYNLYERFSDDYVEAHYGVDSNDVWIVKKGGADSMREANCVEAENDFVNIMHYICNVGQKNDLSDPAQYKYVTDRIDMQSLCDILAVQLYLGNEDFAMSQNITAWRSATIDPSNPYADGKWRFVIYDLDFTLDCSATGVDYTYAYDPFTQPQPWAGAGFLDWGYNWKKDQPFSRSLLKNPDFVHQFSTTFEAVANVDFAFSKVSAEYERCFQRLLPNMENYLARYHNWYRNGAETLEQDFRDAMAADVEYLELRAQYVIPYMRSACGLPTTYAPTEDAVSKKEI